MQLASEETVRDRVVPPRVAPPKTKDRVRTGEAPLNALGEYWPEWLFMGLTVVAGILIAIMLLRT